MTGKAANCDFYALKEDLIALLEFIFCETDCKVFESYSNLGEELREFDSINKLEKTFNIGISRNKTNQIFLQLYSPATKGAPIIRKIKTNPIHCNGHSFRYRCDGWGLMQFYLGGLFDKSIVHSHFGHNSEKRAHKWGSTYPEDPSPNTWDWKELNKVSRKIIYHINTRLVASKEQGRSVLKNASILLENGYYLGY